MVLRLSEKRVGVDNRELCLPNEGDEKEENSKTYVWTIRKEDGCIISEWIEKPRQFSWSEVYVG